MPHIRFTAYARLALIAALGALTAPAARATIDMALNTSAFVPGQSSTIRVDGIVTAGGTATAISASGITLRFDSSKVTLSNLHGNTANSWAVVASNTDHMADGWVKVAMLNGLDPGQTTTGPMLLFTVTPANTNVNITDCAVLRLDGASAMSTQDFETVNPSDPCNGAYESFGGGASGGKSTTGLEPGGVGPLGLSGDCGPDIPSAVQALKYAGGLETATAESITLYDTDADGSVSLIDALRVLFGPCPPTEVEVQPSGIDTNGYGKLAIYWKMTPGAIGYNIYRGTTSGGEDYQSPINGSTPWNTPTYTGSDKFVLIDTGLTFGQEYFYRVKAVCSDGEGVASDEDSDIADSLAIPWDSDDAEEITYAVANLYGYYADLICAVGPDGTVYSNWQGVLRPGGSIDLGTLEPGTNTLHYADGSTLNLPDDGGVLSGQSDTGTLASIPTTEQNSSDGPYRRVRSKSTCTGSYGLFYPGWSNQISMAKNTAQGIDDDYWTYLGSRTEIGSGKRKTVLEIDAGVQWSELYYRYNPYLSLKYKRYDGSTARNLAPKNCPITFDTSYFGGIEMFYAMQPTGKSSTPMILFYGADQNWEEKTVLLAAANPVKVRAGMMKRAHSIAQGSKGGNHYRRTGSHVYNVSFSGGKLRNASGTWVTWTDALTSSQGAYPWPGPIVTWTPPDGHEYYSEDGIGIQL